MHRNALAIACTTSGLLGMMCGSGVAEPAASSSILARAVATPTVTDARTGEAAPMSMFAVAPPKPRSFELHELVQIVVRETSSANRSQELKTKKDWKLDGAVDAWPNLQLADLLDLQVQAGRTTGLPSVDMNLKKDFKGDGDYSRRDDLTDRLTAEVIEILPNGNLVLEARTHIKTDEEESTMKVSGICRPKDVTAANTILSNQIHDLMIEKVNKGQLKDAGSKGILAKVLEAVFAF